MGELIPTLKVVVFRNPGTETSIWIWLDYWVRVEVLSGPIVFFPMVPLPSSSISIALFVLGLKVNSL